MSRDQEQLSIFDPKPGLVAYPHDAPPRPLYRYVPRDGSKCDDCLLAHTKQPDAPMARRVKWVRSLAGQRRFLCSTHAAWWRDQDRFPPLNEAGDD